MTKITNYSDFNGQTVELNCVFGMDNAKFATAFPGITGRRYDSFSRMVGCAVGSRVELPVTRSVEYKAFASKHVCDARCLNASGHGHAQPGCFLRRRHRHDRKADEFAGAMGVRQRAQGI
jgi:hypothetical protein